MKSVLLLLTCLAAVVFATRIAVLNPGKKVYVGDNISSALFLQLDEEMQTKIVNAQICRPRFLRKSQCWTIEYVRGVNEFRVSDKTFVHLIDGKLHEVRLKLDNKSLLKSDKFLVLKVNQQISSGRSDVIVKDMGLINSPGANPLISVEVQHLQKFKAHITVLDLNGKALSQTIKHTFDAYEDRAIVELENIPLDLFVVEFSVCRGWKCWFTSTRTLVYRMLHGSLLDTARLYPHALFINFGHDMVKKSFSTVIDASDARKSRNSLTGMQKVPVSDDISTSEDPGSSFPLNLRQNSNRGKYDVDFNMFKDSLDNLKPDTWLEPFRPPDEIIAHWMENWYRRKRLTHIYSDLESLYDNNYLVDNIPDVVVKLWIGLYQHGSAYTLPSAFQQAFPTAGSQAFEFFKSNSPKDCENYVYAANLDNVHWILVIYNVEESKFVVYDPLYSDNTDRATGPQKKHAAILSYVLREYVQLGGVPQLYSTMEIAKTENENFNMLKPQLKPDVDKHLVTWNGYTQEDGFNCGVFVTMGAISLLADNRIVSVIKAAESNDIKRFVIPKLTPTYLEKWRESLYIYLGALCSIGADTGVGNFPDCIGIRNPSTVLIDGHP